MVVEELGDFLGEFFGGGLLGGHVEGLLLYGCCGVVEAGGELGSGELVESVEGVEGGGSYRGLGVGQEGAGGVGAGVGGLVSGQDGLTSPLGGGWVGGFGGVFVASDHGLADGLFK